MQSRNPQESKLTELFIINVLLNRFDEAKKNLTDGADIDGVFQSLPLADLIDDFVVYPEKSDNLFGDMRVQEFIKLAMLNIFFNRVDEAKKYLAQAADINGAFQSLTLADLIDVARINAPAYPNIGDTALARAVYCGSTEKVEFLLENNANPISGYLAIYKDVLAYDMAVVRSIFIALTKIDVDVDFMKRVAADVKKFRSARSGSIYADFVFSLHCHYAKASELTGCLADEFLADMSKDDLKTIKNRLYQTISIIEDADMRRKVCDSALDPTKSNLLSAMLHIKSGLTKCDSSGGTLKKIADLRSKTFPIHHAPNPFGPRPREVRPPVSAAAVSLPGLTDSFMLDIATSNLDAAKKKLIDGADINGTFQAELSHNPPYYPKQGETALALAVRHGSAAKVEFLLENNANPLSGYLVMSKDVLTYNPGVVSSIFIALTKLDVDIDFMKEVVANVRRFKSACSGSIYADFVFSLHCHYAKASELTGCLAYECLAHLSKDDLKIIKNRLYQTISNIQDVNKRREVCDAALDPSKSNLLFAILRVPTGKKECDITRGTLKKIDVLRRKTLPIQYAPNWFGPHIPIPREVRAHGVAPAVQSSAAAPAPAAASVDGMFGSKRPFTYAPKSIAKGVKLASAPEKSAPPKPQKSLQQPFGITKPKPTPRPENPTEKNNGYDDEFYSLQM